MSKTIKPQPGPAAAGRKPPAREKGKPISDGARARLIAQAAQAPSAASQAKGPQSQSKREQPLQNVGRPWPFPMGNPDPWPFPTTAPPPRSSHEGYNRDGTLMTAADRWESSPLRAGARLSADEARELELAMQAMGRGDHF